MLSYAPTQIRIGLDDRISYIQACEKRRLNGLLD